MALSTGSKFLRGLVVLFFSAASVPVMAGIIYSWQDDSDPGVTGLIEFADGIDLGDIVDPYTDGTIVDFQFTASGVTVGFDDYWGLYTDVELSELGLCSPNCDEHGFLSKKKAAKKVPPGRSYVDFYAERTPTKVKGTPAAPPYIWSYDGGQSSGKVKLPVDGEPVVGGYFFGTGMWTLGSPVPVPEPGTLGLFLLGLASIGLLRRRLQTRK